MAWSALRVKLLVCEAIRSFLGEAGLGQCEPDVLTVRQHNTAIIAVNKFVLQSVAVLPDCL